MKRNRCNMFWIDGGIRTKMYGNPTYNLTDFSVSMENLRIMCINSLIQRWTNYLFTSNYLYEHNKELT